MPVSNKSKTVIQSETFSLPLRDIVSERFTIEVLQKRVLMVPIMFCDKLAKKFRPLIEKPSSAVADESNDIGDGKEVQDLSEHKISADEDVQIQWTDLQLVAVCIVETMKPSALCTDDLLNFEHFNKKLDIELTRLRNVNIDIKLDSQPQTRARSDSIRSIKSDHETNAANVKVCKVEEFLDAHSLRHRWNREQFCEHCKILSTRDPLSLIISYTRPPIFVDIIDFKNTVTTLDLSGLKLTKLDGIEQLSGLIHLCLARNKLTSLKKIASLNCLSFLDASDNSIAKIESLPESLSIINLRSNALSTVGFCENLQLVTKLDVSMNRVRSLKGLEKMQLLEVLLCADNQIKEKSDVEMLKNFSNILFLDLYDNAVRDIQGYRPKVLLNCPSLRSLDREGIPSEERIAATKAPGKALTVDFIDRWISNLSEVKKLSFPNQQFGMIALNGESVDRLQHVEEIVLSKNRLQHFHELIRLENLHTLDLSENALISISNEPLGDAQVMPKLEILILRSNGITNGTLPKLGLQSLQSLKVLDLSKNSIARFDGRIFDLPHLEELNLSENQIKSAKRTSLPKMKRLDLSKNYLKDIELFHLPSIERLNLSSNRIGTCGAFKTLSHMKHLKALNCKENPVTQRRVYAEFIKNQVKSLEELDGEPIATSGKLMPEVRGPPQPPYQNFEDQNIDEEYLMIPPPHVARFSADLNGRNHLAPMDRGYVPRVKSPTRVEWTAKTSTSMAARENLMNSLSLCGKKAIKHHKL